MTANGPNLIPTALQHTATYCNTLRHTATPTAGLPNTGGGGGPSYGNNTLKGGNGGSGVVIIRFKSVKTINTITSRLMYEYNYNSWISKPDLWEITNQDVSYNNGNVNINGINNKLYKLFVGGSVKCSSLDFINNINTNTLQCNSTFNSKWRYSNLKLF